MFVAYILSLVLYRSFKLVSNEFVDKILLLIFENIAHLVMDILIINIQIFIHFFDVSKM